MKPYFYIPLAASVAVFAAEASSMPLAPLAIPAVSILVSSGCGLGVHRGPLDGCEIVYDGNYDHFARGPYNQYYIGFNRRGACGGHGTHYICNRFELCRVVCN